MYLSQNKLRAKVRSFLSARRREAEECEVVFGSVTRDHDFYSLLDEAVELKVENPFGILFYVLASGRPGPRRNRKELQFLVISRSPRI